MSQYKNIIIVGTNNTDRSFMAEVVLHQLCMENHLEDVEVVSRGLVVLFPEPVHPKAADVVREAGYAIRDFQASKLTDEDVKAADLILTITAEEKEKVLKEFGEAISGEDKTIATLSEFAGAKVGIPDPYGKESEEYEICFVTIRHMIETCFDDKINNTKK
ncbi:MAG: hypothetical protein Q4B70_04510 [Lachnospiraceae bacterium]|nr:hypothetical protein [Lachnospiraceae bacterium]